MLARYEKALMAKTTKTSKTTPTKKAPAEKKIAEKAKATEKIKVEKKAQPKVAEPKPAETKPAQKVEAAPKPEIKAKPKVKINSPLGHGVGRRKSSVARVWLRRGKGSLIVNGKKFTSYFDVESNRIEVSKPFAVVPASKEYDFEANVHGGGVNSQAGAVRLGISRALLAVNEDFRVALRKHGLLTVDDRVKERKKYGQPSARAKFQFVKR